MQMFIRVAAVNVPAVEVAFFRSVFGLIIQLPVLWWLGLQSIRTAKLKLHGVRGVLHAVSMMLWFVALLQVPLAEATALEFASPIMATTLAIVFLGEMARTRRIVALLVGVFGVLIVVRRVPVDHSRVGQNGVCVLPGLLHGAVLHTHHAGEFVAGLGLAGSGDAWDTGRDCDDSDGGDMVLRRSLSTCGDGCNTAAGVDEADLVRGVRMADFQRATGTADNGWRSHHLCSGGLYHAEGGAARAPATRMRGV